MEYRSANGRAMGGINSLAKQGVTILRTKDSKEQVSRNRRKFFMKYGFDIIQYVEMNVAGNTDDEMLMELGISPQQLDHFRKDLRSKKYQSKAIL